MTGNTIDIIAYHESLAGDFKRLNLAWLQKYFWVESLDEEILSRPKDLILQTGGYIFFARVNGEIAGTFALIKLNEKDYELSKMAVDERFQGKKIGNRMLEFAIAKAKELRAEKLVLYSNTVLSPAIHLYKKYGFVEVSLEHSAYQRSNIKMKLNLDSAIKREIK